MARSTLSFGMLAERAARMALRNLGFPSGSPPCAIRGLRSPTKKTGTRLAASLSCRTYVPIIPVSASRAHVRVVGEVEIVRARAVKVDPTLHHPVRMAWVDRDREVV